MPAVRKPEVRMLRQRGRRAGNARTRKERFREAQSGKAQARVVPMDGAVP